MLKKILSAASCTLLLSACTELALTTTAGALPLPDAEAAEAYKTLSKVKSMSPGYTGKFIWGLFTGKRSIKDLPQYNALKSLYPPDHQVMDIRYITPGGVGEKEQLKAGDIILEKPLYSSVTSRPGEKIKFKVWRQGAAQPENIFVTLPQYYQIKFTPYQQPAGAAEFEKDLPPDWDTYAALLKKSPIRENLDDLRQRLTDIDSLTDAYRLPVFRYLIRNPFRIEQVSRSWADKISAVPNWYDLLPLSKYMLDFSAGAQTNISAAWFRDHRAFKKDASVEDIAELYTQILKKCADLHKQAFANISAADMEFVRQNRHAALSSICNYHMLSYEPDTASARRTLKIFEILNRIDQQALFKQGQTAALLADERLLKQLKTLFKDQQGELYRFESDFGPIVISGFGEDYHKQDAALIIDLGGNDVYLNNQATPVPGKYPTAVIVDCAGNDYYSSTDRSSQGSGDLGVGMLLDLSGNDTYCAIEMAQGSSFGGIGVLYDRSGSDTYRAMRMSQAAAFFGAGLLIDQSGNDSYTLQHFGQALGSVRGIGILLDGSGDDQYLCKGNQQTSYNTRGHFDGWGQGIGFGVRPFASGGIGILTDRDGCDRYEGGTFTQGGGYYYSFGICCDHGKESDFYLGTRYSQGFAAHQALGAFIEKGGNDIYRSLHAVSLGISWDETVVLFADDQGDDDYLARENCSFSAAHQNGICFFFDRSGNDRYAGSKVLPASSNSYHLGHSLGIFVDSGSGDDRYIQRQNNTTVTEPGDLIFIDR